MVNNFISGLNNFMAVNLMRVCVVLGVWATYMLVFTLGIPTFFSFCLISGIVLSSWWMGAPNVKMAALPVVVVPPGLAKGDNTIKVKSEKTS